ncbi:hypothetical protein K1T71_003142 [Dendrolimus kikuchii]|uniref:Uncharacterized protein n=1 Tax=Dendrolimus kikuchii TaxID=765133 RepID=A0ACC1DCB2_9NEOP|nr:hypothetical protein K1T71_003142 [Dendrolimus kikuchii]
MLRRIEISTLCFAFSFSVLLIILIRYTDNVNYLPFIGRNVNLIEEIQLQESILTNYDGSPNIEKLLERTRREIKSELRNYNFTSSGVNRLEDLLLESGGQPKRSVIISSWRSGSTFLGQILNVMPANYYHYEPFFEHKLQISGPPLADKASKMVNNLLKCNYVDMEDYFEYRKRDLDQFTHNTRLWNICKHKLELCYDADIMNKICKLFPFQSMKLVRYRLRLVQNILEDHQLNIRVVLLIRDPRGVLQSRRHLDFCQKAPDCREPERLCADMVNDYVAAKQLMLDYPGRLKIVRYEELAFNPKGETLELYKFLKLGGLQSVEKFLYSHTNVKIAGVTSTYRITRDIPFKWKHLLDFKYVAKIQMACKEAMSLWGYRKAENATHMKSIEFYPVDQYVIV